MQRRAFNAICGAALTVMSVRTVAAQPRSKGRVLVVVSSAQALELRDGKSYQTGFFLNELATPVQGLVRAGHEPVFATPAGAPATWDPHSALPIYFGRSEQKLEEAKRFVEGLEGLRKPRTLASVRAEGIDDYIAVLIPGGHAAFQDLPTDPDLGAVLKSFHNAGKLTGSLCHGPAALLATLPDPGAFVAAMVSDNIAAAQDQAKGWIYAGYQMTGFTTSEERFAEPRLLKGKVRYYLTEALAQAGGHVVSGPDRRSLTVQDRELITGQQPFSDEEFASVFLRALDKRQASN